MLKNQLPSPFNVTYEGEFICTDIGIIGTSKEEQEEYRKTHVSDILKRLNKIAENNGAAAIANAEDLRFVESDTDEEMAID